MILLRSLSKLKLRACASTTFIFQRNHELTTKSSETLTERLFVYLNKNNNFMASSSQSLGSPANILNKINSVDIDELQNNINDLQRNCKPNTHEGDLLNILDSSSSLRIKLMSETNILRLLDIFMYVAPYKITQYTFYKLAIEQLNHNISLLDKNELLKLLFFLALQKSNRFTKIWSERYLQCLEKYLESFSIEDLCIICNSTFKTSTLIKNEKILHKIKHFILENVTILNDPALFITLCKTLRHNQYQCDNILSTISSAFIFNKIYNDYSFGGLCHVLAMYADFFYYDQKLFDIAAQRCSNLLRTSKSVPAKSYITENIRNKDLTRFLWIFSNVNFKLNQSELIFISDKIMDRIKLKECTMEDLIKCALYLWILNYQALDIIKYYFQQKNEIGGTTSDLQQRSNLLLTCIRLENCALYSEMNEKPLGPTSSPNGIKQQVRKRLSLQRILNVLKSNPPSLDLNRFEYTCEVPYLNIVGITGYKKSVYKCVYLEVLDDYTTLKNTENNPNGLMALKLRLLKTMDGKLLTIQECGIKAMTDNELRDYLKPIING